MEITKQDVINYLCKEGYRQSIEVEVNVKFKIAGRMFPWQVDAVKQSKVMFIEGTLSEQLLRKLYARLEETRNIVGRNWDYEIVGCLPNSLPEKAVVTTLVNYLKEAENNAGNYFRFNIRLIDEKDIVKHKIFPLGSITDVAKPAQETQNYEAEDVPNKGLDGEQIKVLVGIGLFAFGLAWMVVNSFMNPEVKAPSQIPTGQVKQR